MKRKALCIGINKYNNRALTASVKDANGVAALLQKNENREDNFAVTVLEDLPTRSALKTALVDLFKEKTEISLFYYSGHGCEDYFGYHLVTPDASPNDMGVPMSQLLSIIQKSPSENKVVILDCCNAGGMESFYQTKGMATYLDEGVTILASSRHDQLSLEVVNGHSVFTNLLLEALKGGAADLNGDISPGGIYAFIDKALGGNQQRPVFKTNISKFVSLRKVVPQIPTEAMQNITTLFPTVEYEFALNPSFEDKNHPDEQVPLKEPYAIKENSVKFKQLQKLQSVGLVVPVDAPYMFFAAMESKSCKLTPLGKHYWRLMGGGKK